jgi:hypothetical protein
MGKKRYITVTKEIDVDVDIELSDIDTEDLVAELQSRTDSPAVSTSLDEIAKQISFGNKDRALELTANYIYQETGRIVS